VVTTNNYPSEMTQKVLNAIGEYVTIGMLFLSVIDQLTHTDKLIEH
jgi:hypothetical protein